MNVKFVRMTAMLSSVYVHTKYFVGKITRKYFISKINVKDYDNEQSLKYILNGSDDGV